MPNNNYFTLQTTSIGTKRFRAVFEENAAPFMQQHRRAIDQAIDGSILVTLAPRAQRLHSMTVKFDGSETGDYGTYTNLLAYHASTETITFTAWDGTTSYPVVFVNETLGEGRLLTPNTAVRTVAITLLEVT